MDKHTREMSKVSEIARRLRWTRTAIGLLRDGEGIPQGAFAEDAGLKVNAYNQYEQGRNRPSLDAALCLVSRYNITLDWIYLGDPSGLRYELANMLNKAKSMDVQ